MIKNTIIILFFFCSLLSCTKQSPQLPSNKANSKNENGASLALINQNLAQKEDSILLIIAQKDEAYKKSEFGFWYKIVEKSNGLKINDKDKCKFSYQMMLLDRKVIEKGVKQIVIGQKQIIVGLEEGIKLMRKGESASFIIPWYIAYGMNGNKKNVPPYKSVIYNIEMLE